MRETRVEEWRKPNFLLTQEDACCWRQTNVNHVHAFRKAGFPTHSCVIQDSRVKYFMINEWRAPDQSWVTSPKTCWLRQGRVLKQKRCRSQRWIFCEVCLMVWEGNHVPFPSLDPNCQGLQSCQVSEELSRDHRGRTRVVKQLCWSQLRGTCWEGRTSSACCLWKCTQPLIAFSQKNPYFSSSHITTITLDWLDIL